MSKKKINYDTYIAFLLLAIAAGLFSLAFLNALLLQIPSDTP